VQGREGPFDARRRNPGNAGLESDHFATG